MKPGIPWSVKGIDQQARDAAKDAARRSGMTLGGWLNALIKEQAEGSDSLEARYRAPVRRPPAAEGRAQNEIAWRLDQLADQLNSLTRQGADTAAGRFMPQTEPAAVESDTIAELVDRVERNEREAADLIGSLVERLDRIESLSQDLARRPQLDFPQSPEDVPGYVALEGAMRNIIGHIETSETRTRDALKSLQDRLSSLMTRSERPEAGQVGEDGQALSDLEGRVAELAKRLEESEGGRQREIESQLGAEAAQLSERIDALKLASEGAAQEAQAVALQAAERQAREVERRLQAALSETQRDAAAAHDAAREMRRAVATFESLDQRLEDIKSQAVSADELQALKLTLEQLSATVAQVGNHGAIADLERRVGKLAMRVENASPSREAIAQFGELETRVRQLDASLREAMLGAATGVPLPTFESEVRQTGDRMTLVEQRLDQIAVLDRSVTQLHRSLEESRTWTKGMAEEAAREMADRLLADGRLQTGPSPEVRALESGLQAVKASAEGADRQTQETLEAVHETLEQIVAKLAELEARGPRAEPTGYSGQRPHVTAEPATVRELPALSASSFDSAREWPRLEARENGLTSYAGTDRGDDPNADFDPGPVPVIPAMASGLAAATDVSDATGASEVDSRDATGTSETDSPDATDASATDNREATNASATDNREATNASATDNSDATEASETDDPAVQEDFIAAARRAAQSSSRPQGPILTSLSSLSQRLAPASPRAGGKPRARSRLAFTLLSSSRKRQAEQDTEAANAPRKGATRKRLILAGLVLLAAVAAYAANRTLITEWAPAARTSTGGKVDSALKPAATNAGSAARRGDALKPFDASPAVERRAGLSDQLVTASLTFVQSATRVAAPGDRLDRDASFSAKANSEFTPRLAAPVPARTLQPPSLPPPELGTESLRRAALNGDPNAAFIVASRYLDGRSVPQDVARAAEWFGRAAEKGLVPAQYRLATLYERGRGVEQNRDAARAWYLRAAGSGNVKSMHNLGVLYSDSRQATPQFHLAARWFRKAAERGLKDSQYNLAVLSERGLGVETSPEDAYHWYMLAARQGDTDAGRKAQAIEASLQPATLAAVKQRLAEWNLEVPIRQANLVAMVDPAWQVQSEQTAPDRAGLAEAKPPTDTAEATPTSQGLFGTALVRRAQELLAGLEFDVGATDGVIGTKTANAVRLFQMQNGFPINGVISNDLVRALEAPKG